MSTGKNRAENKEQHNQENVASIWKDKNQNSMDAEYSQDG